ncbi:cupin domain-containing protein [Agromyces laixinhei]|uniref:cupin domain-containing protein n=1 Tax=Agromyces laixinhei TaxID=2585717 RepID=UPI001117521E|nr:cupin domain-containing protein [Agromyces laixinhei]
MSSRFQIIATDEAHLREVMPCEDGEVRSRRVFALDGVSLVLISLGRGAVMRDHTARAPILIRGVSGRSVVTIGDERVDLAVGALVQLDAGVPHAVEAIGPAQLLLTVLGSARAHTREVGREHGDAEASDAEASVAEAPATEASTAPADAR